MIIWGDGLYETLDNILNNQYIYFMD